MELPSTADSRQAWFPFSGEAEGELCSPTRLSSSPVVTYTSCAALITRGRTNWAGVMCQSAERGSIKYDRSAEPARRTWGFCFVQQICPNIYKPPYSTLSCYGQLFDGTFKEKQAKINGWCPVLLLHNFQIISVHRKLRVKKFYPQIPPAKPAEQIVLTLDLRVYFHWLRRVTYLLRCSSVSSYP